MKKLLITFLVIAVLAFIGYLVYQYYVPKAIANAITSQEDVDMVPSKIQNKVKELRIQVDENVDKVPELMIEAGVDYEDLVAMVDKAEPDQFFDVIEELKLQNWETTDDVFDIGLKHIEIEGYDLEKFRPIFNDYVTLDKIENGLGVLDENEFLAKMSIPVAKETARKILESRKEEILQKLEKLENQK